MRQDDVQQAGDKEQENDRRGSKYEPEDRVIGMRSSGRHTKYKRKCDAERTQIISGPTPRDAWSLPSFFSIQQFLTANRQL
jgi:hypothetical protein